jgi:hypothetical protein
VGVLFSRRSVVCDGTKRKGVAGSGYQGPDSRQIAPHLIVRGGERAVEFTNGPSAPRSCTAPKCRAGSAFTPAAHRRLSRASVR